MKLSFLPLLIVLILSINGFSQASLVKDINNGNSTTSALNPTNFIIYKDRIYYSDDDHVHGRELWVTDGTTEGTHLFKDISPGVSSSNPMWFTEMNGLLYFSSIDLKNGTELWRTDGTSEGTILVKNINPGAAGSFPNSLTAVNDILYFNAYHKETGRELWRSDGTPQGTYLVKDINAGIPSSSPYWLTNLNGVLLFSATDEPNGGELWRSNGTEAGTYKVKDISPEDQGSGPLYLTVFKNHVYFSIDTAYNGEASRGKQIWKSNGTESGTSMVLSNEFDGRFNSYHNLMAGEDHLYFYAIDHFTSAGGKIWKTDGTNFSLIDESVGAKWVSFLNKIDEGNFLYTYSLTPDNADPETHVVYVKDATGEIVMDESFSYPAADNQYSYVTGTVKISETSFVWQLVTNRSTYDPESGEVNSEMDVYLIRSQEGVGSTLIKQFTQTSNELSALYHGKILFGASIEEQPDGSALYKTDGTTAGTTIIKSMTQPKSSYPEKLTVSEDKLFFTARANSGVWVSDGTGPGTLPIEKEFTFTNIYSMVPATGGVYFSAYTPSLGQELWKSDGTSEGTTLVTDSEIVDGSWPDKLTRFGNGVIFRADNSDHGKSLWKTDGTTTTLLKDLSSGAYLVDMVGNPTGTMVYFLFDDNVHGLELWKSDGTPEGTTLLKDIVPGEGSSGETIFRSIFMDDILYFSVMINGEGELWRSDGTEAGTAKVKGFEGELDIYLMNFCPYKENKFLFTNYNQSLWISDGTSEGTIKLKDFPFDIIDGNASGPRINSLVTVSDTAYFFKGAELWQTNGTSEGTKFVTNFPDYSDSGPDHASVGQMVTVNGSIQFIGYSPENTSYLWTSNGTESGTRKIANVKNARFLTLMNDVLYFAGEGDEGVELWKYIPEDIITDIENEISTDEVYLYPNPGFGPFTIALIGTQPLQSLEVIDHFGRSVSFKILQQDQQSVQVKLDQEISGVYLCRMLIGGHVIVRKIIVQ